MEIHDEQIDRDQIWSMLTNRITTERNSVTAARILIAKCVLNINIIIKLLFSFDLIIRGVFRINNFHDIS